MDQSILLSACGLLFAGNIFFFKKLVEKVETNNISSQRMEESLERFDTQLKDLKQDLKDLRKVEMEVAILMHEYKKGNQE